MGRHRDPRISKAVEEARKLMKKDAKLSVTAAARKVGIGPQTLRYRLGDGAELPDAPEPQLGAEPPSEIPLVVVDYSDQEKHSIYPMGDFHIGAAAHAKSVLEEWLNFLRSRDNVSLLCTGDVFNAAIKTSVSDVYAENLTVKQAREYATKLLRGVQMDAVVPGNHEQRIINAIGDDPLAVVAELLDVPYAPASVLLRYLVGDQSYDLYMRHGGGGGGGTMGALVNRLEKQERIIEADIYVTGHTHTQVAFPKITFIPNAEGKVERKKRLFVSSGSFLWYEDYAASAGYAPGHIGAPRLFLDGRRQDAHASV